ncbi:DUF2510 domain-containing protein [Mycobacteroides abscessus]|uniref:DUF2510 domain-containing protein n=3 Tax=Mycobacteroides abscessus TaxID=36809 RepID=UPI001F1794BB|nr:DUF2510 domain-containing protein [Mycobacteroides abscessus]
MHDAEMSIGGTDPGRKPRRGDPDFFDHLFLETEANHRRVLGTPGTPAQRRADLEWVTKNEMYQAGLISASDLHQTGSRELLPKGWYYHYVEGFGSCPARVWGIDEIETDDVELYHQGYRFMTVFSDATGPRGDFTSIDVRGFAAAAMTENGLKQEADALDELSHMGYDVADLPAGILLERPQGPAPTLPPPSWSADPTGRFQYRWWDGQRWTHFVARDGKTFTDPL